MYHNLYGNKGNTICRFKDEQKMEKQDGDGVKMVNVIRAVGRRQRQLNRVLLLRQQAFRNMMI